MLARQLLCTLGACAGCIFVSRQFTCLTHPCTLNPTPQTLDPTPQLHSLTSHLQTLISSPFTLHPSPDILHRTPYTLHPITYTLHPSPYTLNLKRLQACERTGRAVAQAQRGHGSRYKGTSLIRNSAPLAPYIRTMSRALRWSWEGGWFTSRATKVPF